MKNTHGGEGGSKEKRLGTTDLDTNDKSDFLPGSTKNKNHKNDSQPAVLLTLVWLCLRIVFQQREASERVAAAINLLWL